MSGSLYVTAVLKVDLLRVFLLVLLTGYAMKVLNLGAILNCDVLIEPKNPPGMVKKPKLMLFQRLVL